MKSEYYHCGIAMWLQSNSGVKRLFICEAGTKRRLILLSVYKGLDFDVIACPVDFELVEDSLLNRVGVAKYSFATYLAVGLRYLLGISFEQQRGEICSMLVQSEYRRAGLEALPEVVMSPGELHNWLLNHWNATLRFEVKG
jgi:hypothetical protein